jgi:hypothetical protein
MRRFSTIGLAALLAVAPGFSGDSPAQPGPSKTAPILASTLITVADDFIVDVYHNGVKLPDDRRELVADVYGATVERIKVDVRLGDWLVFNVVNNRMRWSGSSYFAVKGQGNAGFRTELDLGRWSCCDDPGEVGRFIAERGHFADHRALPIAKPWAEGDTLMKQHSDGGTAEAIWGGSRNTWIKFLAF